MNFEEYIDLIKKNAENLLTGDRDKFFDVLNEMRKDAKETDKKIVQASTVSSILIPVKYKNETFAKVIACYVDDYNLAMKDMEDPEKFAAILSILNDKLAKDGDVYDMSTPETKILGLANRYANNARECQYARQWRLFAFYMRSLAYFIPQLIEKANMTEEKIMNKIESKLNLIRAEVKNEGTCPVCEQDPCICDDYADDVSPNGLTARVTKADTELSYQELYNELDEKFRMAKNSLDRIEARYKYRTLQNVSYPLDKANKLQDELWNALDKIDKDINKLWSKIG